MGTKLVIWDWNGTLLDDTMLCCDIANRMRAGRGMPLLSGVEEYRSVFCFPIIDYYRRMGYTFETESYEAVSVDFISRYTARVRECPLHADVLSTLDGVAARGIGQVLLSATNQTRLDEQAGMYGIFDRFERVIGTRDDLAYGKEDVARDFIASRGLRPEEVLFVGDTDHDYAVATAIGCRVALVANGHHQKERLAALGAPVFDAVFELLAFLDAERGA